MYFRQALYLFAIILATAACNSQLNQASTTDAMYSKVERIDGKCYAKSLMPNEVGKKEHLLPIYTGKDTISPYLESFSMEIKPASTRWVKKKADQNCVSADPNDCLVWCLEKTPPEVEQFVIVTDTTKIKDFHVQTISQQLFMKMGGHVQRVEVRCPEEINPSFVSLVSNFLHDKGFLNQAAYSKVDAKFKSALTQYQRANQLPVGQFDTKTLAHMGL